jgi:hypothetical protein
MSRAVRTFPPHVCDVLRDTSPFNLRRLKRGQLYAPDALSPWKDPNCLLNRKLVVPHIRSGRFGGEKNPLAQLGISVDQSVNYSL